MSYLFKYPYQTTPIKISSVNARVRPAKPEIPSRERDEGRGKSKKKGGRGSGSGGKNEREKERGCVEKLTRDGNFPSREKEEEARREEERERGEE